MKTELEYTDYVKEKLGDYEEEVLEDIALVMLYLRAEKEITKKEELIELARNIVVGKD